MQRSGGWAAFKRECVSYCVCACMQWYAIVSVSVSESV